jgi:hypothetical protein
MVIPVEIAVIAALGAIYYGYHAVQDAQVPQESAKTASPSPTPSAEPSPVPTVDTTRLVSKKGGFAVGVPKNVKGKKIGVGVTMTTADQVLSAVVAPVESGTISASSAAFLRGMKKEYTKVRVVRSEENTIDGHQAKATYGRARNANKVKVTFVNVVVKAEPRNFAINAFSAADSDPTFIVPRVNSIIHSFEVIEKP